MSAKANVIQLCPWYRHSVAYRARKLLKMRPLNGFLCLIAAWLIACASAEPLDESEIPRDEAGATGGSAMTTGGDGRSGRGGSGTNGGGMSGAWGGGRGGAGGDAGGIVSDASAGRSGSSGATGRDASLDETSTTDATEEPRVPESGAPEAGDSDGGTCGPAVCFDVFDCWIFFPQCGYTACNLLACTK